MGKQKKKEIDRAKSAVLNKYKKLLKKEGLSSVSRAPHERSSMRKGKTNRLLRAHNKAKIGKKSKEQIVQEKAERAAARSQKLRTKKERQKKMNMRTKKGQPVMKNRVELMLQKIITDKDTYQSG